MLTLPEIKSRVDRLAAMIGASSEDELPTYGYSDGIHPCIEFGSQGYYYLVLERDVVCDRLITKDLDELLYKVFSSVTHSLSMKYELAHRTTHRDSRRVLFQHQVDLLTTLNPEWGKRKTQEIELILNQHPFRDSS